MLNANIKAELIAGLRDGYGRKPSCLYPDKEASFAKMVFDFGLDYLVWGIWGIKVLGLNRNALNNEYNQIEKLPWRVDYFKNEDFID